MCSKEEKEWVWVRVYVCVLEVSDLKITRNRSKQLPCMDLVGF